MEQTCMVLRTFRIDCEQRGPLNEHPVVDVRIRLALLRTMTLWGTWYIGRRINPMHTAPLDRSHKSSENLKQITATIHYVFFILWFLLSFFFPRLISAVGDWMSTIFTHMVWP